MFDYSLEHLFSYVVSLERPQMIGAIPEGIRAIFYVTKGEVTGPKLRGRILPGGGEWHPDLRRQKGDIVVREHWAQSGFANTDLDFQLKQHGITHVIVVGLLVNTYIESTARYAMELGYHVTLVRDATAAIKREMMHAVHELNGPTYAHAILRTCELVAALPKA